MVSKFHHCYRIQSSRLPGWDYRLAAYYFITICTRDRNPLFGEIQNNEMYFFALGKIAHTFWLAIPNHFPNTKIDEFVIMPNHLHGILIITYTLVETQHAASLQHHLEDRKSILQPSQDQTSSQPTYQSMPKTGSLSVVIGSYKSAVTRWAHQNGYQNFAWQSRFYDHIIRSDNSLNKIRRYILDNPIQWELDEYNPLN